MRNVRFSVIACAALVGVGAGHLAANGPATSGDTSTTSQTMNIEKGTASFYVPTNITALEVSGKSTGLQARVTVRQDGSGTTVQRIEAWMPVKSLNTGLGLRDEHMRRLIFTTAGGEVSDLRFESGEVDCPAIVPGREMTCAVNGSMAIRNVPRAFSITLKLRQDGPLVRASGDGVVKLSDYGIERPTQLGVKTADEVKIHLDLSARELPSASAAVRRAQ